MLKIIFQDDSMMVINKPPALVMDDLSNILQKDYGIRLDRGGVVHRLDKDTSGLLLVAKTLAAFENLQSQFKQRQVKKEYLALVHGLIEQGGKVQGAVGRNPGNREKFTVLEGGKEAETEYKPLVNYQLSITNYQLIFKDFNKIQMRKLERINYNQFTLIICKPLTGRTHQIRVHLKYIGHPVVADDKYAGRKMYRLDKRWCPRQFLHAKKLGFYHSLSGEWMEFESPLPDDLDKVWKTYFYSSP